MKHLQHPFSYTLDGFMEAQEYLSKSGKLETLQKRALDGRQLVDEANRLIKRESKNRYILNRIREWIQHAVKLFTLHIILKRLKTSFTLKKT